MIIAIDGPAGSGKSSTAKLVAKILGIIHLDTGAMYRAVTLKSLRRGIKPTDLGRLASCVDNLDLDFENTPSGLRVFLDGEDVTEEIRSPQVTRLVSDYCKPSVVRTALVTLQRRMGSIGACVCEGRDIGTVVFPEAPLKVFMVASVEIRAERRLKELNAAGVEKTIDDLIKEIEERDHKDSTREISPLKKADDAVELDTSNLSLIEQAESIVTLARQRDFTIDKEINN